MSKYILVIKEVTMKDEIKKWKNYCNGDESINYSDFYTLLMDEPSVEELNLIFNCFPEIGKELRDIVMEIIYFDKNNFDSELRKSPSKLLELVKSDFDNIVNLFQIIGNREIVDKLKNLKLNYTKDINIVNDLKYIDPFHSELVILIGDHIIDSDKKTNIRLYGLREAIYGLTNNPIIVNHIISKFLYDKIDFSNYFKLWINGGDYAITENGVHYGIWT